MTEWEIGYKLCHYKVTLDKPFIFHGYPESDNIMEWLRRYQFVTKEKKNFITIPDGYYWEETLVQIK